MKLFLPDFFTTQRLGYLLGKHLPVNSVIMLSGNLGAGKTTLVQGMGQGLGIEESVVSPTFTLVNEYLDGRLPLYHLDLYRLESNQVDSIYPEMYWEGVEVNPGITAIEWWQRLIVKPVSYLTIDLIIQANGRQACIEPIGINSNDLNFLKDFN